MSGHSSEIVREYFLFWERVRPSPQAIYDEGTLPRTKREILQAIVSEYVTADEEYRAALMRIALDLPCYQAAVGAEPIHRFGFPLPQSVEHLSKEEMEEMFRRIAGSDNEAKWRIHSEEAEKIGTLLLGIKNLTASWK